MAYLRGEPFTAQFIDPATGLLMQNGTIEFYLSETSTPTPYYTNSTGTSGGTSLTLDSGGQPPNNIFFDDGISYKIVTKNASGATLQTIDPYNVISNESSVFKRQYIADLTSEAATIGNIYMVEDYASGNNAGVMYFRAVAAGTGTADGGSYIDHDTLSLQFERIFNSVVSVKDFGAVGDGVTNDTVALQNAIISLRANEETITQYIGGPNVTAYSSGTIEFPPGVFVLDYDVFDITQDLGLTLKGAGSRRTNQAIIASTTLLFKGTSSGFGFKFTGNGARAAHFEDLDICYEDANFTGDLVDSLSCPGLKMTRVRLGCFGNDAGSRVQSANSLIRTTYDEFHYYEDCVFDGAVNGWWSDDVRSLAGITFGGFGTTFVNCVWYDFTGNHIKHDGNRTRQQLVLINPAFNPINIDCVRVIDVDNIDGIVIKGGISTPSTSKKATTEWMEITNSTGVINGHSFGDLSKAGTLQGNLELSGNKIFCTDGFDLTGGNITSRSNEFAQSTNGYNVVPTIPLTIDLGPDQFKSSVTTSYNITPDSVNLGGRVNYSKEQDASTGNFVNASARVNIRNVDERFITVSSLPASGSILETGRIYNVTAAGTFTLPTPIQGTRISVHKQTANALTIAAPGGTSLIVGDTGSRTSCIATTAETGAMMEFIALSPTIWVGKLLSGNWTFT